MLRTNPPPIVVLGLLRLTSGAVNLSVNFTRLEAIALSFVLILAELVGWLVGSQPRSLPF